MSKHSSYLSFKKSAGRPSVSAFYFAETIDEIDQWHREEAGDAPSVERKSADAEPSAELSLPTLTVQLISLMRRFKEALLAYHALINLNSAIPPIVEAITVEQRVLAYAKTELELVSECDSYTTFGVPDASMLQVYRIIAEFTELQDGFAVIPGSVMLSLVATFDSLVSDFMKLLLKRQPERFVRPERTITFKEVLSAGSFQELTDRLIDDEVDQTMRGSHSDQVKYIETNFKLNIRDHYERWSDFIEIFERRNVVAHGSCSVNQIYLANCRAAKVDVSKLEVGDSLALSPEYLHGVVDILTEFGVLLVFKIGLNTQPDNREELYSQMNHLTFELIRTRRPKLASWLLDFALNKQTPRVSDSTIKMMTVNLVNALRKSGQLERSKQMLEATDWTATSDDYKICVAALRDDVEEFVRLMECVKQAGTVKMADFREWPVFDWVRKEEAVQAEFLRLYGEPLLKAPPNEPKQISSDQTGEEVSAGAS